MAALYSLSLLLHLASCAHGFWSWLPEATPGATPRLCPLTMEYCFSYDRNSIIGPDRWDNVCDTSFCFYGENQSPIFIDPTRVERQCDRFNRLGYNSVRVGGKLENDGYYPKLTTEDHDLHKAVLQGVPGASHCNSTYLLDQLHIHFGRVGDSKGSEHVVKGRQYDGELHLVHERDGLGDASSGYVAGYAVVAVFLSLNEGKESIELNRILDSLTDCIEYVVTENRTTCTETVCPTASYRSVMMCPHWHSGECGKNIIQIIPELLLPFTRDFYYYYGSLTTPTLSESVLWHVMTTPIKISLEQLELMRKLESRFQENGKNIPISRHGNLRPFQPLNERRLLANICNWFYDRWFITLQAGVTFTSNGNTTESYPRPRRTTPSVSRPGVLNESFTDYLFNGDFNYI